jgi:internalin A
LAKIREAREQRLRELDLSIRQNDQETEKLKEVPTEIFELIDLELLFINSNHIGFIPNEISHLKNLRRLTLVGNRIANIPNSITLLENLELLDLYDNRISFISIPILEWAWLLDYKIIFDDMAPEYGMSVGKNLIEVPPPEVISMGLLSIIEYYRQLQGSQIDSLYEAKLIIIGEPGSGKTSLAKKIQQLDYQLTHSEPSTEGIDIIQFHFPLDNGKTFRVNIWDFGGQEIYHATHQFFLTKRSLYALVDDSREEQTDFYYWLNTVELLSDSSPLLIIQNQKQDRKRDINQPQLRGQFPHLKDTLETNLATNRGLPHLLETLKHHLKQLPHIGSPLPKTWVNVRNALDTDSRNTIHLDQYLEICTQNGFTRREDALQLSSYLHDLGVCLHFQDDEGSKLYDTLLLKPTWGTTAVYKVLDNPTVRDNFGSFNWTDLKHIWSDEQYASKRGELLELMKKFQLCYEIPTQPQHYIAPQLLKNEQPTYPWNDGSNLILRYTYDFMPKGILTRFIVVMHQRIQHVWKTGVILLQDHTQAEVIEYYGKREIKIRIQGSNKRDLMTIVTHELDKIHASYHRLKYQKLIPCLCSKCNGSQDPHFYKFADLKRRIEKSRSTIECEYSYEQVNVRSLIDDVMPIATLFRSPRTQREIESLQRTYDTLSEKIDRLRNDLSIQAGSSIVFQLEHELEQAEADRNKIEQKLSQLESY